MRLPALVYPPTVESVSDCERFLHPSNAAMRPAVTPGFSCRYGGNQATTASERIARTEWVRVVRAYVREAYAKFGIDVPCLHRRFATDCIPSRGVTFYATPNGNAEKVGRAHSRSHVCTSGPMPSDRTV